jgi:transcriptional regulator with XRE-family HTH domain
MLKRMIDFDIDPLRENIETIRKEKGMSRRALSLAASGSAGLIRDVVERHTKPRYVTVVNIAKALNVPGARLLGDDDFAEFMENLNGIARKLDRGERRALIAFASTLRSIREAEDEDDGDENSTDVEASKAQAL